MVTTGEKIAAVGVVPDVDTIREEAGVRVIHGRGRTLMSGLGDAHTHFTWNGGDLDRLGDLGVEEHTLLTMRSAQCFLDSGYTMFVLLIFDREAYDRLADTAQVFWSRVREKASRCRYPRRNQRRRYPRTSLLGQWSGDGEARRRACRRHYRFCG